MSLLTISLPALHNGVSQQPPLVRAPDQCEAQENCWASLSDGLVKRPPTETVAKIMDEPAVDLAFHQINRDASERYTVVAGGGAIRVFDEEGTEIEVDAPAGWDYLTGGGDARSRLSMTSIADYTFLVNREVEVLMLEDDGELTGEDDFVSPRRPGSPPPWKMEELAP